ncbi:hypothetical protein ARTHRO9V_210413 [Arthrobacter sp. 9V]|nr:hypothetical protein ARTHRO9V_210413 [Arthrobacter sp. 9V]
MGALGASIFPLTDGFRGLPGGVNQPDYTMLKFSGTVVSAFESEARRIRLAAYGARLERVLG